MSPRDTLAAADPISKLLWVANTSVAAAAMRSPSQLMLLLGGTLLSLLCLSRVSVRGVAKYGRILMLVPGLLFAFHLFLHPGTPIYQIGFLKVTREGLATASVYSLQLFCSISAVVLFLLTTDLKLLIVSLIRLKVPLRFAYAIYLMLRFIPIMAIEADTIRMAFRTRAPQRRLGLTWIRLWERYLFALVFMGVRRAQQTALAMDSRGFAPEKDRTFLEEPKRGLTGACFLAVNVAFSWAVVVGSSPSAAIWRLR